MRFVGCKYTVHGRCANRNTAPCTRTYVKSKKETGVFLHSCSQITHENPLFTKEFNVSELWRVNTYVPGPSAWLGDRELRLWEVWQMPEEDKELPGPLGKTLCLVPHHGTLRTAWPFFLVVFTLFFIFFSLYTFFLHLFLFHVLLT